MIAQGKWQIVTDLSKAGVNITQLPLSRTSRAENVDSHYLVVGEKLGDDERNLGCFQTASDASLRFPSQADPEISNKIKRISQSELRKQTDGIYQIMFKQEGSHLIVTGTIPLAIQDIPFMTVALNYDLVEDVVKMMLGQTENSKKVEPPVGEGQLKLDHIFPYEQLQIEKPQNPPFSLAIGAKITKI